MFKHTTGNPPADAILSRELEPPTRGLHVGSGVHVLIPSDWFSQCRADIRVAGCTAYYVGDDGDMFVSQYVQNQIAVDAIADAAAAANGLNHGNVVSFRSRIAAGSDVT